MKFLATALVFGLAMLSCQSTAWADDASKKVKIEEILQITHTDQMLKQTMEQVRAMQMDQLKKMDIPADQKAASDEIQRRTLALVTERLSYERAKPLYVQLYAEVFSEDEIDGIMGFYKSPAGKAMIDKMPMMMQRLMPMMQRMTADLQADVQKIVEEATQKQK